jgi:heme/copper-type cytochrome/quinol oxidase subunit 2
VRTNSPGRQRLAAEAALFGLGYAAVLIWAGVCLVASFGPSLASPYWPAIPGLRTDTTGVIAFAVAAISLLVSRYLQLRRRREAPSTRQTTHGVRLLVVQAAAETAAVLCTGVVIYLSLNAVTHPDTLRLQLTHLWPWPSEGTVRVIALGVCLVSVAAGRYLRAASRSPSRAALAQNAPAPVSRGAE